MARNEKSKIPDNSRYFLEFFGIVENLKTAFNAHYTFSLSHSSVAQPCKLVKETNFSLVFLNLAFIML